MLRKDLPNGQSGSVTVLVIALLPVFILAMGWSVDTARVLAAKVELYKATDLAARELARELDLNKAAQSGEQDRIGLETKVKERVVKNLDGLTSGKLVNVEVEDLSSCVRVTSTAEIPLVFSGLAGREKTTIRVTGIGRLMIIKDRATFYRHESLHIFTVNVKSHPVNTPI